MPVIVIASGTSTSGKSSIARLMAEHGYVVISLDAVFDETRPDINKNMFMDDLNSKNPDRKEMCKRIRAAYAEGKNIFVDEVFGSIIKSQLSTRKYNIITLLVYAPISKLMENYESRKLVDYRSMKGILSQYRSLYIAGKTNYAIIDTITKTSLSKAAKLDRRSFNNNNDLNAFIDEIATDMQLPVRSASIVARESYDIIVINDTTPDIATGAILDFISENS